MQDADGTCPGRLSVAEWEQTKAALRKMSPQAAKRTSRLMVAGKIEGAKLDQAIYGEVTADKPETIKINREHSAGSVFDDPAELPKTIVHESEHVEQLKGKKPGAEAQKFINECFFKCEREARKYADKNYVP